MKNAWQFFRRAFSFRGKACQTRNFYRRIRNVFRGNVSFSEG